MTTTRRSTLAAIGGIGALAAAGPVLGIGDHEDDERDDANETDGTNDTDDADEEVAPTAAVRIAHFSPDAPNVDVYVDDEQVLADVAYDTISPYLEIAPGSYQVRITAAGDPETVVFDEEVPVSRAFYTIAAIGELEADTFRALVLTDAGSALIRLVHASPDAPAVDVVGSESPLALFENVAFGKMTNYVALPAATYSLNVRPAAGDNEAGEIATETDDAGNETGSNETDSNETDGMDNAGAVDAVATVEITLEKGTAYTAFATGYLKAEPPFAVRLAVDGPGTGGEPMDEMPADDGIEEPDDDLNDTDDDLNDTDDGIDNDTDDDLNDTDDDLDGTDDDDGFGDNGNETDGFGDDNETDDLNDTDDDDGFGDDNDSDDYNETDDDCEC